MTHNLTMLASPFSQEKKKHTHRRGEKKKKRTFLFFYINNAKSYIFWLAIKSIGHRVHRVTAIFLFRRASSSQDRSDKLVPKIYFEKHSGRPFEKQNFSLGNIARR